MTTDWDRYQQCPVCFAELCKPCEDLFGYVVDDGLATGLEGVRMTSVAEKPHTGRKLRAGR